MSKLRTLTNIRFSLSGAFFGWALPCLAWLLFFYVFEVRIVQWPLEISKFPAFRDFLNLWSGAVSALHSELASVFDKGLHEAEIRRLLDIQYDPALVWSYPPTALLLMLPFGLLPFPWAVFFWSAFGLGAYFLAAGVRDVGGRDRVAWIAAIALCPGVFTCLAYVQTAFLTSAALITGLVEARRRPLLAGLCFSLLAAKPQIAIVVPFVLVAIGAWRAFAATAVFGSLFIGATIAVFGIEAWRMFLDITLPQQLTVLHSPTFIPVVMISPYFMFRELGASQALGHVLQMLVSLAAVGWLFVAIRQERDENIRVLIAASAALLVSAYMQAYELPLLVAAVARICANEKSASQFDRASLNFLLVSVTLAMFVATVIALTTRINFTPLVPLALLSWLGWRALAAGRPNGLPQFSFQGGRQA